jgi:DNA-binding MarR family transcriptional regulator
MGEGSSQSLGTDLRRLIALLDDAVEQRYTALGLNYRPRFTPVVRALQAMGPSSIMAISTRAGLSHSATSQTVAQMVTYGLLRLSRSRDGRERIVEPTSALLEMMPVLQSQWRATDRAAARLDGELSHSLLDIIGEAISVLERKTFGERIAVENGA